MKSLSLEELNDLVRQALELTMPDTYWVRAEIAELRVAANGHCYLELVQHSETNGQIQARARANIWRNTYAFLRPQFERESGQRLQAGLQVLLEVQISFHTQYGYALTVTDIDPTYTLGNAARRRKEILRQLEEDGVLTMNKELPFPHPAKRIAVISSTSAAGYGDFLNQIEQSGLPFRHKLFPAIMQGEQVEDSIINALNCIANEQDQWDIVVIIRGGGAVTDLGGFESYALAANIAQFPLPVITGIGHERDETVIDFVAHTRLKTPTAVAAFLVDQWQELINIVNDLETRLRNSIRRRLAEAQILLTRTDKALTQAAMSSLEGSRRTLTEIRAGLSSGAIRLIATSQASLTFNKQRLAAAPTALLREQRHRISLAERSIQIGDPIRILRQGYSITRQNGKAVRSVTELKPGQTIVTTLADGEITSTL